MTYVESGTNAGKSFRLLCVCWLDQGCKFMQIQQKKSTMVGKQKYELIRKKLTNNLYRTFRGSRVWIY